MTEIEHKYQSRRKILVLLMQILDGFCQEHSFSWGNMHIWQEAACQEKSRIPENGEQKDVRILAHSYSYMCESRNCSDVCESWSECLNERYAIYWSISDGSTETLSVLQDIFSEPLAIRVCRSPPVLDRRTAIWMKMDLFQYQSWTYTF